MIVAYGWGVIGCTILVLSFGRMLWTAWTKTTPRTLWADSYFWLLGGVAVGALALGEIMLVRVFLALGEGVEYVQPAPLGIIAALTVVTAVFMKMRALAINNPRQGTLFMWLCGAWSLITAAMMSAGLI